jgi:hypothetical protein
MSLEFTVVDRECIQSDAVLFIFFVSEARGSTFF